MSRPHYLVAERIIDGIDARHLSEADAIQLAQVHATLALVRAVNGFAESYDVAEGLDR